MKRKPIAFTFLGFGALLAVAAIAGPPVLPILNPPVPSFFTCKATGSGAICRAQTVDTLDQVPTGIVCGTAQNPVELLLSGTDSFRRNRFYDTAGNLTGRLVYEHFEGTLLNPATGLSANNTQITVSNNTLATPGDVSTETSVGTGTVKFWLPGGGVLLRDVGRTVVDPDDNIINQTGQHQLDEYFAGDHSVAAKLCEALGSPGTP